MGRFNFSRATDDILSIRISKKVAEEIRKIAKQEDTTIQEVCRIFLEVALQDYQAEPSPTQEKVTGEVERSE